MKNPLQLFLLMISVLLSGSIIASNDSLITGNMSYLEMKGRVLKSEGQQRDDEKVPLDSAVVTVFNESGARLLTMLSDSKGRVDFKLPMNKKFLIKVTKSGFVQKIINVDTRISKENEKNYSFAFDVDIFESVEGLDVSVLNEPVAKVSFKAIDKVFSYDVAYTTKVNVGLQKMYREYYAIKRRENSVNDSVPAHKNVTKQSSGPKKSVPYGKSSKPH